MRNQTYKTAFYPLNETGIDLTFAEVEYKIIEKNGNLIKAEFVNIHHKVDALSHVDYELPSFFIIDTSKQVFLNEDGKAFASTTLLKVRE